MDGKLKNSRHAQFKRGGVERQALKYCFGMSTFNQEQTKWAFFVLMVKDLNLKF
jgi:hypothetical protein